MVRSIAWPYEYVFDLKIISARSFLPWLTFRTEYYLDVNCNVNLYQQILNHITDNGCL